MQRILPLAVAVLMAAGLTAVSAQTDSTFSVIALGDGFEGRSIVATNTLLGFTDLDSDGRADAGEPDETVYLDIDGSRSVTYGDVRLSTFLDYAAGTTVAATNRDLGRALTTAQGWIASTSTGTWVMDVDGDRAISVGDVRFSATFGDRVLAGDADLRTSLQPAQQQTSSLSRLGYLDLDSDNARDPREPLIFDLDPNGSPGQGKATNGDLRLTPVGPGVDDTLSRAEFEDAIGKAGVQQQNGSYERTVVETEGGSSWGMPETVLLLLALVNLAGLAFVYTRLRSGGAPRNPFK
jgi:hypothetical protein